MRPCVVIVAMVACGARQPSAQRPAKGAIAGVISERPGVPANGAVVLAYRDSKSVVQVGADERGRYRLELPAGTYRAEIYHAGQTVQRDVVVEPGRTSELDMITDPLARCAAANHLGRAITSADRDAVIAETLAVFARTRPTLANEPESAITPIVLPATATLAALPLAGASTLVPVTVESLTADAARTHLPNRYLQVEPPRFEGGCAIVSVTRGVIQPPPELSPVPQDPASWLVEITESGPVMLGEVEISLSRLIEDDGSAN